MEYPFPDLAHDLVYSNLFQGGGHGQHFCLKSKHPNFATALLGCLVLFLKLPPLAVDNFLINAVDYVPYELWCGR